MGFENPGRPWPGEREGPAAKRWEGFSFQTPFPSMSMAIKVLLFL